RCLVGSEMCIRDRPSSAELKLMRLIQANPALSKQLME
ncbi:hypothetical protein ACX3V1_11810, partial [Escherichia coli]